MSLRFLNPFGVVTRARNWYARYERPISSLSLIGGFIFNAVALTRADELKENLWIAVHILVVAGCIIFINRAENNGRDAVALGANPTKLHFWLVNILQFMFGGLLSTFLVFYFRSAAINVSWPFFLILVIAFIANESLKRQYTRLYFQIAFLFLSIFLFAIFVVPVIVHAIGPIIFIASGILSLVIISLFLILLRSLSTRSLGKNRLALFLLIAGIYLGVNALYFFDIIPPLPLSLRDAGIYHSITRSLNGDYVAQGEITTFVDRIKQLVGVYPTYHGKMGSPVYVFSAIFSPSEFSLTVAHEWQKYDSLKKQWITSGIVTLPIKGGRDNGYRTYSAKAGLTTGKWRVNVETSNGQVLGRLVFNVVIDESEPVLQTEIKK